MALIPPFFLDCVLALGFTASDARISWVGTGFLYGARVQIPDEPTPRYAVYLVTNRHVRTALKDQAAFVRCNPAAGEETADYDISEKRSDGADLWHVHPEEKIDVAVIKIDMTKLRDEGMRVAFFANDKHVAPIARMRDDLGLTEGDFVYVLGFPMGLAAESNTVVARGGCLARVRDMHAGRSKTYLVDSQFFPGNSGGPVVSKPEGMSIQGTKSQNAAYLIGIAHSYVSYHDAAVSLQTGRTRIVFEENSGLAVAHPIDCIEEVIDLSLESLGLVRWTEPKMTETT